MSMKQFSASLNSSYLLTFANYMECNIILRLHTDMCYDRTLICVITGKSSWFNLCLIYFLLREFYFTLDFKMIYGLLNGRLCGIQFILMWWNENKITLLHENCSVIKGFSFQIHFPRLDFIGVANYYDSSTRIHLSSEDRILIYSTYPLPLTFILLMVLNNQPGLNVWTLCRLTLFI